MLPDVAAIKDCARLFPRTVDGVTKMATQAMNELKASVQRLLETDKQEWKTIASTRDDIITSFTVARDILGMVKETAIESTVQSTASKSYVEMENFFNANFRYNKDLKKQFSLFAEKYPAEYDFSAERKYYVKETLDTFRHNGLDVPDDQYTKIQDLNAEMQVLTSKFDDAISADSTKLVFTVEELKGTPQDVVDNLSKDESGNATVGLDYPTYFAIQRSCEVSATREKLARAFENRAYPENAPVLKNLLEKRRTFSGELKFDSYASWDLFRNMAGTTSAVSSFLSQAVEPLQKKWRAELKMLLEASEGVVTPTASGKIKQSDIQFMIHKYKQAHLNVDENIIKEYFPVEYTIPKLFEVIGSFFDIDFIRADYGNFWAEDVFAMTLICRRTQTLLGHIVCDLYPRDKKYSHACCASIRPRELSADKKSSTPGLAVVLANFPKTQLMFSDVETLAHELGHAVHAIFGISEMASLGAYNVKLDFVEVPSQVLEEWAWEKDVLQKISSHYKTGAPLPDDLIDAKLRARFCFAGYANLRQILLAKYSLVLHQDTVQSEAELDEKFKGLWEELFPEIEPTSESHFSSSFGHLSGYGASYYSYHYSKAFAIDVLHYIKEHGGVFDATVGHRYREMILDKGGSLHPHVLMRGFLDREPDLNAFWKHIGIDCN